MRLPKRPLYHHVRPGRLVSWLPGSSFVGMNIRNEVGELAEPYQTMVVL